MRKDTEHLTARRAGEIDNPEPHELLAEERELTLAFQRGEVSAYETIYERYAPRVESVCYRMLGNPFDAQEASQETFLRVYQSLARFNGRYQLGPWITRIATNICLDHIRSRSRKPADATPLEILDLESGEIEDCDPQLLYLRKTEGRRVRRVLASLPPLHRAAIVLRDFEGLCYADIATALDLSEAQVKALIHRARKGFRKSWTGNGLAALLPWRLLSRIKDADAPAKEPASQAVASAGQAAASCTGFVQHCGQALAERLAPVLAAAVVGTAGAAVASAPTMPAHEPEAAPVVQAQPAATTSALEKRGQVATPRPSASVFHSPESSSTPTESPSPLPSASPSPTGSPSPGSGPGSGEKDPPPPTPSPPALGFDRGQPIPSVEPKANTFKMSCSRDRYEQRLETTISDGDQAHPALFVLNTSPSSTGIELTVWKDGHEVLYNGGGELLSKATANGITNLYYSGSYGWNGGTYPNSVNLPQAGRFELRLRLDCVQGTVITERVVFGT